MKLDGLSLPACLNVSTWKDCMKSCMTWYRRRSEVRGMNNSSASISSHLLILPKEEEWPIRLLKRNLHHHPPLCPMTLCNRLPDRDGLWVGLRGLGISNRVFWKWECQLIFRGSKPFSRKLMPTSFTLTGR